MTKRRSVRLGFDPAAPIAEPSANVRQLTLRPDGLGAPLDALVVLPAEPRGVLVYFPGYNTPLGPWEAAKCRLLAQESGLAVVVTELPGMSRFGDPIPAEVRATMLRRMVRPWAELALRYVFEALWTQGIDEAGQVHVLGFSTGCSLAAESVPGLQALGPIVELTLVEPVAIRRRPLVTLQAHNTVDYLREIPALRTNLSHEWVMTARRRQNREPMVRYGPADMVAIARVLAGRGLAGELAAVDVPRCNLVRGEFSSLCPADSYAELDELLNQRELPGDTVTVAGLGHPLWHSFPAIVPLVDVLIGKGRAS